MISVSTTQPLAREKLPQLDVLRGICAIVVALNHIEFQFPLRELGVLRNGALFVDFFFVLSGFIISYNYTNIGSLPELGRFMGLRFYRVYPLHVVMLLVFWAYEVLQWAVVRLVHLPLHSAPFSENNALAFFLNLVLLNGVGLRDLSFNVPSWSISTEFWTYLVYGLLLVTFADRPRLHAWLFLGVALAALAVLVLGSDQPSLTHDWVFFLPRCVFSFFLGALIHAGWSAVGIRRRAALRAQRGPMGLMLQCASIALALAVVELAWPHARELEFAAPFVFAFQIAAFALFPDTALVRLLTRGPLLWLGTVSYSIYMVHMIVLFCLEAFLRYVLHAPTTAAGIVIDRTWGLGAVVLYMSCVLGVAALTYRFIEAPGRQLGRVLLAPRRAAPPRVQTVP